MTTLQQIWDNHQVPLMERKTAQRVFKEWLHQELQTVTTATSSRDLIIKFLKDLEQ